MKQMSDSQNSQPTAFMNHLMKLSNKTQVDNSYIFIKHNFPFFSDFFKDFTTINVLSSKAFYCQMTF